MNSKSLGKSVGKSVGPNTSRHHKHKNSAHSEHKLGFGVGGMALAEPPGGTSSKTEEPREALPTAPNAPRPKAKAGGQFVFPQVISCRSTTPRALSAYKKYPPHALRLHRHLEPWHDTTHNDGVGRWRRR